MIHILVKLVELMSIYNDSEDLINIGAYSKGSNPSVDIAIQFMPIINQFLRQGIGETTELSETLEVIQAIVNKIIQEESSFVT